MPKTIQEIYSFWAITRQYFDDQARDFLRIMRSPSESDTYGYNQFELQQVANQPYVIPSLLPESGSDMRNRIAKENALAQLNKRRSEFGQTKNLLLKQKMDILAWLSRSSRFLTESLAQELLEAFRETEVPYKDAELRKRFLNQVTDSQASLSVANSLQDTMRPRAFFDLPGDLRHYYEQAGLSKDHVTNQALVWPLKVLEILVSNNEQAEICLFKTTQSSNLVHLLGQILILHGWGDAKALRIAGQTEASVILNTVRVLASLLIRPAAQDRFLERTTL